MASREEKGLYAMVAERRGPEAANGAFAHPGYAKIAHALVGLQMLETDNLEEALGGLQFAIAAAGPLGGHPFMLKYFPHYRYELTIYRGISASLPLGETLVRLAAAEALQASGRQNEAIDVVEACDPTIPAALSLADLYAEVGRWEEVVALTDGVTADSPLTAGLVLLRAEAQLALGHSTAAKECIRPLISQKKLDDVIRHRALAFRAEVFAAEGSFAKAQADLERVLAENSRYPGLHEALAALKENEQAVAKAKEEEKKRAAAEKLAERERARAERSAEADRLREERARARENARPAASPAAHAGFIDLMAEDSDEAVSTSVSRSPGSEAQNEPGRTEGPREPGFYPDPEGVAPYRFWDGSSWTTRIRMKP